MALSDRLRRAGGGYTGATSGEWAQSTIAPGDGNFTFSLDRTGAQIEQAVLDYLGGAGDMEPLATRVTQLQDGATMPRVTVLNLMSGAVTLLMLLATWGTPGSTDLDHSGAVRSATF